MYIPFITMPGDINKLKKGSYAVDNLKSWISNGTITQIMNTKRYHVQRMCYDLPTSTYYVTSKIDKSFLDHIMKTLRPNIKIYHLPEKLWHKQATVVPGVTLSMDLHVNVFHSFMQLAEGTFLLNGTGTGSAIQVDRILLSGEVNNWKSGM